MLVGKPSPGKLLTTLVFRTFFLEYALTCAAMRLGFCPLDLYKGDTLQHNPILFRFLTDLWLLGERFLMSLCKQPYWQISVPISPSNLNLRPLNLLLYLYELRRRTWLSWEEGFRHDCSSPARVLLWGVGEERSQRNGLNRLWKFLTKKWEEQKKEREEAYGGRVCVDGGERWLVLIARTMRTLWKRYGMRIQFISFDPDAPSQFSYDTKLKVAQDFLAALEE